MSSHTICSASRIVGDVTVSGDKSLSHRVALLAGLAEGATQIENFSASRDCEHTLGCLQNLGARIERISSGLEIHGQGLFGLRGPEHHLDAGNSGSTIRMLAGIVAGQRFSSTIDGDASLRRRPMKRVIEPLRRMGAVIEADQDQFPPLHIEGRSLRGIRYQLPVPSAQVKSCLLLAGLLADGSTTVEERLATRDHTELMLPLFGARIERGDRTITVHGGASLAGTLYRVPGDISSAAFLIAAGLLAPEADLVVRDVLLNPTRTGYLDFLMDAGAPIRVTVLETRGAELVGQIAIQHRGWIHCIPRRIWEIDGDLVPRLVDELPLMAILATVSPLGLRIGDAGELRVKESDRIRSTTRNLQSLGVEAEEAPDGMFVPPTPVLRGGVTDSFGDHRIAMALAVAALRASEPITIMNSEAVEVSFPGFFDVLRGLQG